MLISRIIKPKLRFFLSARMSNTEEKPKEQIAIEPFVEDHVYYKLKLLEKCNTDKLKPESTFEELGFDSLDRVELLISFEDSMKLELDDQVAETKIMTVKDALEQFSLVYRKGKVSAN